MSPKDWATVLGEVFTSPNEADRNGELANVVDGLYFIGRCLLSVAAAMDRRTELERQKFNNNRMG